MCMDSSLGYSLALKLTPLCCAVEKEIEDCPAVKSLWRRWSQRLFTTEWIFTAMARPVAIAIAVVMAIKKGLNIALPEKFGGGGEI